jgi:hypothetical protein
VLRCSADRLTADAAFQRLEWARRCALITNTGGPGAWVSSTWAFDTTFAWAKDYVELDRNHAYSSSLNDYHVNDAYAVARYESSPLFTVFQEASGPTAGFWKWAHTTQRSRPLYPTFDSMPMSGTGTQLRLTQLFPLPTLNDCNLYQQNAATGVFTRWTGNFYVVAYCQAN